LSQTSFPFSFFYLFRKGNKWGKRGKKLMHQRIQDGGGGWVERRRIWVERRRIWVEKVDNLNGITAVHTAFSSFASRFDLSRGRGGIFPHCFNTRQNQSYVALYT